MKQGRATTVPKKYPRRAWSFNWVDENLSRADVVPRSWPALRVESESDNRNENGIRKVAGLHDDGSLISHVSSAPRQTASSSSTHHSKSRFRLFAYQGRFTKWWLCPRLSVCTDFYLSPVQPRRSAEVRVSISSLRTADGFRLVYPSPLGVGSRYNDRASLRAGPRRDSLGDCRKVSRQDVLFLMTDGLRAFLATKLGQV